VRIGAVIAEAQCGGSHASARGVSCFASLALGLPADSKPSCATQIMPGAGDSPKLLACATAIRKEVILVVIGISR
jgi:hypothetical protein